MADPHVGGEGIGQLHETASGGTGSVDTVMHELGAGGGDGNAAGQQVPAVAFFWEAYISIEDPLTRPDPVHP